jgi:GTP-binding protein Era
MPIDDLLNERTRSAERRSIEAKRYAKATGRANGSLALEPALDHKRGVTELHRTGFVALSGLPNAGKSTLLNAILGQTVSIVSPKPQTTRNRIVGIHNLDDAQIVLVDTPGLRQGSNELGRRMFQEARAAVTEADVVLRVVDASHVGADVAEGFDLSPSSAPTVVALNKIDRVRPKDRLLPMLQRLSEIAGVEAVVPISALKRDGVDRLLREVVARLPEGPPLYPPEMITDRPERFMAAELVRAEILKHTRQEVPHAAAVAVTAWHEIQGAASIEAVIYVEKDSQRGILIGRGGSMVKRIGTAARQAIGELLGTPVHLKLRVTVSSEWRADPAALRELGYDE